MMCDDKLLRDNVDSFLIEYGAAKALDGQKRVWAEQEAEAKLFLQSEHGIDWNDMWTTDELTKDFDVEGFLAPFVMSHRKSDGARVTHMFGNIPPHGSRIYYNMVEDQ